jgi:DNA-binding response OmpR family regulator
MTRRILVIEDQPEIAQLTQLHLRELVDRVDTVGDGASGLEMALSGRYDLIILDLMLPALDGLDVCRRLRASDTYIPILILTARSSELDRVLGLELGADDYVTKPFSIRELVARVKAIFRRVEILADDKRDAASLIVHGELHIDPQRREVSVRQREVALTAREFDLLLYFARNPGRVFRREQLLSQVWGYGYEGYEHTVNSHINRLRAKIERDPAQPEYILTVWGVGYKLAGL